MTTYRYHRSNPSGTPKTVLAGGYYVTLADGTDVGQIRKTDGGWRAYAHGGREVGVAPTRYAAADLIWLSGTPGDAARMIADYQAAMADQATAEQEVTRQSDRRARAVAGLSDAGWSYARIGDALGLSRARVQQLVQRGREA